MRRQCDDVHLEFVLVEQIFNIQHCEGLLPPSSPKKPISMLITHQRNSLAIFWCRDNGLFHCDNCCVVSHLHPQTDVSLHVIISEKISRSFEAFFGSPSISWHDSPSFPCLAGGTELMEICTYLDCLWKSSELTQIYFLMLATSKIIILLFSRTSSFTWRIFLLILPVSGHPEQSAIQGTPLDFRNH